MPRKIVQIATANTSYDEPRALALCEDGTVWLRVLDPDPEIEWHRLPAIPEGDVPVENVMAVRYAQPDTEPEPEPADAAPTPIPSNVGTLWFIRLAGSNVATCRRVMSVQDAAALMEDVAKGDCFLVAERMKELAVRHAFSWRDKHDNDLTKQTWRAPGDKWRFDYISDEIPF